MATYVVLGHGGFNPEASQYPPEVLVPPDTMLKFYADAGSALQIPAKRRGGELDSDYAKVAPAWQQIQEKGAGKEGEAALGTQKVTYNYALYPDDHAEEREAAKAADWGGAQLIMIESGKKWLCMGTAETCPTPALLTSTDESVLTADRWKHHCAGILGESDQGGYAGNEIHWVACSSFEIVRPDLPSLVTASTAGPGLNVAADWVPNDAALDSVMKQNRQNVTNLADKAQVALAAGGVLVLIGEDHNPQPASYVDRQGNKEEGIMTFKKGGVFSKAGVDVKGITKNRGLVEKILGELLPDKSVTFV